MSSRPGLRSGPFAMPISGVWCSPCSASTSAATPPAPCRRRSRAGRAPDIRRRRCARSAASTPRASPRNRRRACAGVTLKRRYSDVCIASLSKMTHDATAASPIVCETSKHSIRCADGGRSAALPAAPPAGLPASPSARASAGSQASRSASPSSARRAARRRGCRRSRPCAPPAPSALRPARRPPSPAAR